MIIEIIPIRSDNYCYLIIDEDTHISALVDPADPIKVKNFLSSYTKTTHTVQYILTTHKHGDHAGGNSELSSYFINNNNNNNFYIIGGQIDNVESCNYFVNDNDIINIGSLEVRCIHTPGHTLGHICYYIDDGIKSALFSGDCLFQAGCGRFFEGTSNDYYYSLYTQLWSLPDETRVYCGHEYTSSNLRFAIHVDPDNSDVQERIKWAINHSITIPSKLSDEKKFNPFLRIRYEPIKSLYGDNLEEHEILGALRNAKNNF